MSHPFQGRISTWSAIKSIFPIKSEVASLESKLPVSFYFLFFFFSIDLRNILEKSGLINSDLHSGKRKIVFKHALIQQVMYRLRNINYFIMYFFLIYKIYHVLTANQKKQIHKSAAEWYLATYPSAF